MLSVTTLSSYLYCPRSIYLTQVLKVIKPAKKAIVKGTIKHNTFDFINKTKDILSISKFLEREYFKTNVFNN